MEKFRGKIEDEAGNFIMDVEGFLSIETPPHGLKSWWGTFSVKPSQGLTLFDRSVGVLQLEDGRSGRFMVKHYSPQTGHVQFRGTGPLQT
jgi:hypothetical protein